MKGRPMSSDTPTYRQRTRPIRREDAADTPAAPLPDEAVTEQHDHDHEQSATSNPDETPVNEGAPYKVGYKKPPLHSRFQRGVCANPKGRPRGAKNMRARIMELANEKVLVRENGQEKRMSKIEIGAKKAFHKFAETGDLKNLEFLFKLEASLNDAREGSGSNSGSPVEKEKPNKSMLQWFLDQSLPKSGTDGEKA
jgi:hypothetical protein